MKRIVVAGMFGLALCGVAWGEVATCTWKGGGDTAAWNDATNWKDAQVPTAGDKVVIDSGTAEATGSDIAFINTFSKIVVTNSGTVFKIKNLDAAYTFSVPLEGDGCFSVRDGAAAVNNAQSKYLSLTADNTAFTGPFFFSNASVKVYSPKTLGTDNYVTNLAINTTSPNTGYSALVYMSEGIFNNHFVYGGTFSVLTYGVSVTNAGPVEAKGYTVLTVGGSMGRLAFTGPVTYDGGSSFFIQATQSNAGTWFYDSVTESKLSGYKRMMTAWNTLHLACDFNAVYGDKLCSSGGSIYFERDGVTKDTCSLQFGDANSSYGYFNLNGHDQVVSNLTVFSSKGGYVTSATPATLTVKGSCDNKLFCPTLTGVASFVLDSSLKSPGTITFTNGNSTTYGNITAKRGTIKFEAGVTLTNVNEVAASGAGKIIVTKNAGALTPKVLVLDGDGEINLAKDITVWRLRVDGVETNAADYAAGDFGGRLTGTGKLTVLHNASCGVNTNHNADTLAFYPFDDVPTNTPYLGVTVRNDAGTDYQGTVTAPKNASDIIADDDRPGEYIFDGNTYPGVPLYTHPNCVKLAGKTSNSGENISFDALASSISSNDDYTIEFFWKEPLGEAMLDTWSGFLIWDLGAYYWGTQPDPARAGKQYPFHLILQSDYIFYQGNGSDTDCRCTYTYGTSVNPKARDGKWHHMAITYQKSEHVMKLWGDYTWQNGRWSVTNEVQTTAKHLLLGNGGNFRGKITCLRVSKKCLAAKEFLRASNVSTLYPETVFHLSCDGAAGSTPTIFTNIAWKSEYLTGQYIEPIKCGNGEAITYSYTDGGVEKTCQPVLSSDIWRPYRSAVYVGTTKLRANETSVALDGKVRTDEARKVPGAYITVFGTNCTPVSSGSFTLEGFFKFDVERFEERLVSTGAKNVQALLLGMCNDSRSMTEWSVYISRRSTGAYTLWFSGMDVWVTKSLTTLPANFLKDNKWHHIAIVYDLNVDKFHIYFDYVCYESILWGKGITPYTPAASEANRSIRIGGGPDDGRSKETDAFGHTFSGNIDEIRYTRRALLPEEFLNSKGPDLGTRVIIR